jgi:hypothetical protein
MFDHEKYYLYYTGHNYCGADLCLPGKKDEG